ncbi:ubiquinone anaerobic biosynthesis accessory factor UbiT [Brucella thiophenivorans]|uniref:SCP-2 sterol transfer family protein n=1 Tax=Brucella thiophenivorans TaxID=571255 RepID=A0A256FJ67_9HYPH|nr:SCP2 domain-containing protein [Brucella thiophenivorans]OYR14894.1 SCP-2 sterol transfer family protein [Brucella thiophenivorans]
MMKIPSAVAAPARLVPPFLLTPLFSRVFLQVIREHPGLFERLGEYVDKRFGFSPSDLPFMFVVEPSRPAISVFRKGAQVVTDAAIDGPLVMLLALLEGKLDGDALFFSRDITVTGDMEAMLALRNALDDCDVDLPSDLGKGAGPFAPIVRSIASYIREKALSAETPAEGERKWN